MRYAVLESNWPEGTMPGPSDVIYYYVVNIVLWDGVSEWSPGARQSLIKIQEDQSVDIGWTYDYETGLFTDPTIPVGIGTT
jgi:hypothetical protein